VFLGGNKGPDASGFSAEVCHDYCFEVSQRHGELNQMSSIAHVLGWTLLILGWLLAFLGSLWIITLGWQRNVFWGVICFLVPVIQLVYVAAHWKESKEAFFLLVAGLVLVILAALMGVPGG